MELFFNEAISNVLIYLCIRRDQVDLVVSGREGKIFGSVGRKNNNKNISQIYNMFFSCDKDSAGKGVHIKKCENMY